MNVNNNNVIQMLRSNGPAVESRDAAIELLNGFHNHQYGQFIVLKYKAQAEIQEPNNDQTTHSYPLMVAVGVEYPDEYAIVFDGDLKTTVSSVDTTDNAKKIGLTCDPMVGNVLIDLNWQWEYDADDGSHKVGDNVFFENIHRFEETPVEKRTENILDKSEKTQFKKEVWSNDWWTAVSNSRYSDNFLILGYKAKSDDNEVEPGLGWMSMTDFIVDSLNTSDGRKYWWQDDLYKTGATKNSGTVLKPVAHPEIVAPSLESVGKLKDKLEKDDAELSKRINDVHKALHDYAEWDAKNNNLSVFLNDGGPGFPYETDKQNDPELIQNLMCLYIECPEGDEYYIGKGENAENDEIGVLYRKENPKDSGWDCPIKPASEERTGLAEWDDRFEK